MSTPTRTITRNGFIIYDVFEANYFPDREPFRWTSYDPRSIDGSDGVFVCENTISFEVPVDFDPRVGIVTALEAKKKKLQADFSAAVAELNRQINELLAIEG